MHAVVFDIGGTLIQYSNPMNWQALYRHALERADQECALGLSEKDYKSAIAVLEKYNTRITPRIYEVSADRIFREILDGWQCAHDLLQGVKRAFFSFYTGNGPHPFEDVPEVLRQLKSGGVLTATLSDVAYGLENKYALADLGEIAKYIDLPLTSNDIGYRKPDCRGLELIADRFKMHVENLIFVGDEEKDVICANSAGAVSILIDREGRNPEYGQRYTIHSMEEVLCIAGCFPGEQSAGNHSKKWREI